MKASSKQEYRAGTSEMCTFLSGTPHACTTQPQLVKLQEVKILLIPQCMTKTDCENSIAMKSYMHIYPMFGIIRGHCS